MEMNIGLPGDVSESNYESVDGTDMPTAWFVKVPDQPSWLVYLDPHTGVRASQVVAPVWNRRMADLESEVVDGATSAFVGLAARIDAELADQHAKFDDAFTSAGVRARRPGRALLWFRRRSAKRD
jgi:hypothetical protein